MRIRSGYSFRTAYGHLPEVASRIQEIGWTVAPISDRNSTFGFTRWTKLCEKAGLRPMYGVELAVVPALGEKKPIIDYWSFFAKETLRPLHELIGIATNNPGKEPSLLYKQALEAPGIFKIAGERLLLDQLPQKLPDDFFIALSPSTPFGLMKKAIAQGLNPIMSGDNYFPRQSDEETYRVALGFRGGTQTYPRWILNTEEWIDAVSQHHPDVIALAMANAPAVERRCIATQKKGSLLKFPATKTLRELCLEGAVKKSVNLENAVYSERLERELLLIAEKDFADYFFILADMIGWAKQRMIVGPARGSSCGSLVCYLLDITAIDPIPYGLIFERFIDTTRKDLPDIDVDFSDVRRHLVFEYAEQKYGKDHIARLGTVGQFMPRSAIKQAGMQLCIPLWRTDKVMDSMIERSFGDSRAMLQLEDTLNETESGRSLLRDHPEIKVAAKLEGHPNNPSQHAAGIIITNEPIREFVAVDERTRATMCDKKDAETLNLLKIDALGLTQLSIFERTLELIGEPIDPAFFDRIPLADPKAFAILNDGRYSGIFQFAGTALRSVAGQVTIDCLEDIVALTALARPGPLATGGAASWTKRKQGKEEVTTLHPMLTDLTKETFGVVVYQETVMNIVRNMGRMSWEDTSAIRKAMSGRLGDEFFAAYWQKFLKGALENGIEEHTAKAIWDQVNTFGSWAFNKSHAVAYGIVSYWCCWLKVHHPIAFAAATLDAETDSSKQIAMLKELKAEGVDYKPFDAELSTDRWEQGADEGGRQVLIGPLSSIKGIGPAMMREILDTRKSGKPIRAALKKRLENAKTEIDSLTPIADRVHALHSDLPAIGIESMPTNVVEVQPEIINGRDVLIFGVLRRLAPVDENEAAKVTKRGRKVFGPTAAINMFFRDDTGEIFCKISRHDYVKLAPKILEIGKTGKSIFAVKGPVPKDFRMISVKQIKYLGDME